MSIARKLVLLMGIALAALALTASTATAENSPVEVIDEHTLLPCDPCHIHIEGESAYSLSIGGSPVFRCHDSFEGTIDHAAFGAVEWVGSAHGAPGCTVSNCTTGDEAHWPVQGGHEEAGLEFVNLRFCLRGSAQVDIHCNAEVPITHEGLHHYSLSLINHRCAGGAFFVTGAWEIESTGGIAPEQHDEIEIVHLAG